MTGLIEALQEPRLLVLVLLVFGAAPGLILRLLALAYPKDDPRRAEMIGEFRAVPTLLRPLWVAQQLELATFDGVPARWSRWRRGRAATEAVAAKDHSAITTNYDAAVDSALAMVAERSRGMPLYARPRHVAPRDTRRVRAALVPAVLLASTGSALGGLAASAENGSGAFTPPYWLVAVVLALVLLLGAVLARALHLDARRRRAGR